jgi:plasmid stabilization system protein ParE
VKRHAVTKKPRAKADLLEHYVFIGQENVAAADRFLAAAKAAFKKLATNAAHGSPLAVRRAANRCGACVANSRLEVFGVLPADRHWDRRHSGPPRCPGRYDAIANEEDG